MGVAIDTATYRADFVDRVMEPMSVRFVDLMVKSSNKAGDRLFPIGWSGHHVSHDMQHVARRAEMFTATEEMCDLVQHAAESLPPQTLEFSDLPAEEGWLYLPKPLVITDVRQLKIPISFVMWSRRISGYDGVEVAPDLYDPSDSVVMWAFVRLGDPNDPLMDGASPDQVRKMAQDTPYASLTHVQTVAFGRYAWKFVDDVPGSRENVDQVMRSMHDLSEFVQVPGEVSKFRGQTGAGAEVTVEADPLVQFLFAYWHFVKSELADVNEETLPRQLRRQFARKEIPTGPISVVRLRKRRSEAGDGEWSLTYRHVRRGHWRRQWYGSKGSKYQRWIWIAPTIVGPDDAPLVERDVVNLLVQ